VYQSYSLSFKKGRTMKRKLLYILPVIFLLAIFSPHIIRKAKKIRDRLLIHEHGYWMDKKVNHYFDKPLAEAIATFLKKERARAVVDFGCGADGHYVKYLLKNEISCDGFDGNPYSPEVSDGLVRVLDLSEPINIETKYDWVISLEVGEHIPAKYETTFVENLHKANTKGIILSWAVEDQKGRGHFNCRNNDYIKNIFAQYGYENDVETEKKLRNKAHFGWFHNTIMVFRKKQ